MRLESSAKSSSWSFVRCVSLRSCDAAVEWSTGRTADPKRRTASEPPVTSLKSQVESKAPIWSVYAWQNKKGGIMESHIEMKTLVSIRRTGKRLIIVSKRRKVGVERKGWLHACCCKCSQGEFVTMLQKATPKPHEFG